MKDERLGPAIRDAGDNAGCGIAVGLIVAAIILAGALVHAAYVIAYRP